MIRNELSRNVTRLYSDPALRVAQELVEEEHADEFQYPTDQVARILRLFDGRRIKNREIAILALAPILGGALGALGGILAG